MDGWIVRRFRPHEDTGEKRIRVEPRSTPLIQSFSIGAIFPRAPDAFTSPPPAGLDWSCIVWDGDFPSSVSLMVLCNILSIVFGFAFLWT